MKLLFVSAFLPEDPKTCVTGLYQRMRMFIDAMKEIGEIDMLFYVHPKTMISSVSELESSLSDHWEAKINLFLCPRDVSGRISAWEQIGPGILRFFRQSPYSSVSGHRQVCELENCVSRKPDAIFVHRLVSMCPVLLTDQRLPHIFFDLDDIEHKAFTRSLRQPPIYLTKHAFYLHLPALIWGERRAIRRAKLTFVCSDGDRNYLSRLWHLPGIVKVPNAVRIPELPHIRAGETLLFLGNYVYRPNAIGAEFLIERVWPRIHRIMPEARLIIAGSSPENIRGYDNAIPGVEFAGFVENLEELYQRSRAVCCPIFSGGGTRIKIIEAAAFGKAIVSTRIGAEGLGLNDGRELLLRDDEKSFAEACVKLLRNGVMSEQLGRSAREKVKVLYSRQMVLRSIQSYMLNALKEGRK